MLFSWNVWLLQAHCVQPCCYFSGSGSGDYVLMSNPVYKALIGLVVVFFFPKKGETAIN